MAPGETTRLDGIESKLAHLELAVSQISDEVARQQRELDQALAHARRLTDRLAAMGAEADPGTPAFEKPPHY